VINMLLFPLRISSYKTTFENAACGAGNQSDPGKYKKILDCVIRARRK